MAQTERWHQALDRAELTAQRIISSGRPDYYPPEVRRLAADVLYLAEKFGEEPEP